MTKWNIHLFPVALALLVFCVGLPSPAFCRLNLPEVEGTTAIEGQDHNTLREFFLRTGKREGREPPEGIVLRILLGALPEVYSNGCKEMVSRWGEAAAGTAAMSVSVLHVDSAGEDAPVGALLSYGCFSTVRGYESKFRDERLASLVIGRAASRLVMMPDDKDCDDCATMTRIRREKTARIHGRAVVGLTFLKTGDNPCCQVDPARQEQVNFYSFYAGGAKPAGTVLKSREEYAGGAGGEKTVYSAAVILKKDMKGNIVGILAPFTVTKGAERLEKGMIRYEWAPAALEFRKQ